MLALRRSMLPMARVLPSVMRWMATDGKAEQVAKDQSTMKTKVLSHLHFPHKAHSKESSLHDIVDTLKCVNYRYDYPQKLSDEQKKSLKRFDIFR